MQKIHYPGIVNPSAAPVPPVDAPAIEIPVGAKTAEPITKPVYTLKEAVDQMRVNMNGIMMNRLDTMLKFGEKRDSVVADPNKEEVLQQLSRGMQFLDNQRGQLMNMYTAGVVLLNTREDTEKTKAYYADLPELMPLREEAIDVFIKLATDPKALIPYKAVMALTAFSDYHQYQRKLDI